MAYNIVASGTTANLINLEELKASVNGNLHKLAYINSNVLKNNITLPTTPNIYPYDTVLTTEQIASGVIKHADASNSGLIVNGKFDTDTSGWGGQSGGVVTYENDGYLTLTNTGFNDFALQIISTIVGKKYIVEGVMVGTNATGVSIVANRTVFDADILGSFSFIGNTEMRGYFEFTALSTTTYIRLFSYGGATKVTKFDNIAVYPADAISRSDLSFLESWHEDISEKNFVYPLGNVQYLGSNTDGLTGIANGVFTGFEQYSLFGNWQTPSALIGKGYVWSSLSEAQKRAFIANPENNCYLDGDKTIQVRYRVRVVQGLGDSWTKVSPESVNSTDARYSTLNYTDGITKYVQLKGKTVSLNSDIETTLQNGFFVTKDKASFYDGVDSGLWIGAKATNTILDNTSAYEGKCYAIPLVLVHRKNLGLYHNTYNPNGTKLASDGLDCFRTTISFNSAMDCFDPAKLLTASGYIGTVSGRPDGLFYDQVHESDIIDLRNSSKKPEDYNRLISREFNKLVAGTTRGKQGELYTEIKTQTTTGTVATVEVNNGTKYKSGDVIYIYDLTASTAKGRFVVKTISSNTLTVYTTFAKLANSYMISGASSTRTKSNTLLVCDVIGNPANYPSMGKTNEVAFTTLHTAEDGTSLLPDGTLDTFKLSRKANATPLLCLRSTDSGVTWTSFTPTFSTITNAITLTDEPAANLVMVYYQTHTSMAVPVVNSEVLEIGDVVGANGYVTTNGLASVANSLIGKTMTSNTVDATYGFYTTMKFSQSPSIDSSTKLLANSTRDSYYGKHPNIYLYGSVSPACKVFPYLTRLNGKAYLNLVFKEMKYNGTSWGDDNKFNIVDNVSTTTDNNAQTVLIGQKTVELPYFIGADE